jgi:hypothetical protein
MAETLEARVEAAVTAVLERRREEVERLVAARVDRELRTARTGPTLAVGPRKAIPKGGAGYRPSPLSCIEPAWPCSRLPPANVIGS